MMSADSDTERLRSRAIARVLGTVAVLVKPFGAAELLERVHRELDNRAQADGAIGA